MFHKNRYAPKIFMLGHIKFHSISVMDSQKNLHQHDNANLTSQRPAKFYRPSDFF